MFYIIVLQKYTCSASNAAATVNFSAHLSVKGSKIYLMHIGEIFASSKLHNNIVLGNINAVPPSWSQEPTNLRALLKSDVIIPCHAIGWPQPTIKWFRGMYTCM